MKKLCSVLAFLIAISSVCGTDLIRNGSVRFSGIVIPENPVPSVKHAAEELAWHLGKTVDQTVPVLFEKEIQPEKRYIFVGPCHANEFLPDNLPLNTGILEIRENSIHIAGNDGHLRIFSHLSDMEASKQPGWNGFRKKLSPEFQMTNSMGTLFAAYEFLEKYLGIRWLWPGEDGTVVPKHCNLSLPEVRTVVKPCLQSSMWSNHIGQRRVNRNGFRSEVNAEKFYHAQNLWLLRHRFNFNMKFHAGHSFVKYYSLYEETIPDIFSLLPNGTRKPSPLKWTQGGEAVSMCVSNPRLLELVIADWLALEDKDRAVNVCENDTPGECTCEACLSMDDAPESASARAAAAKTLFDQNDKNWMRALGSLSNRYCHFWLNVQKEVDKYNPDHQLRALIYANYSQPPSPDIKLNDRMILSFCPPVTFPITPDVIDSYKKTWSGWADTGARLIFRPNFTWDGNMFPIQYHREFYEMYIFAAARNLHSVAMDSLTGQYAVQGLTNYVIATLNHNRDASLDELEETYFSAFGAAKEHVKKYIETAMNGVRQVESDPERPEGSVSYSRKLIRHAPKIYTPELLEKCSTILDEAINVPGLDPLSARRVEMLRAGLRHVKLEIAAEKAYQKFEAGEPIDEFLLAVRNVEDFRAGMETGCYTDMGIIRFFENLNWKKALKALNRKP